jgi:hypothetical protein
VNPTMDASSGYAPGNGSMNAGTCLYSLLSLQSSLHNGPAEVSVNLSRFGGYSVREQLRFELLPRSSSAMAI